MSALVSVIIPVYNAASTLAACLDAVSRSQYRDFECLVADDGSTDASRDLAARYRVSIYRSESRRGPACARNMAAANARGDILLFIDADVCIEADTITKVVEAFDGNASLDALIGSYDDEPAALNFMSQYKNLMHCYFHQQAKAKASTFWTGCGAIRREVFQASGGFDECYARPSIEDIELGSRMLRANRRIELEPSLTVKHLKHWTFLEVLKSDIRDRAIPWTLVVLRERKFPNDLNTQWSQRFSVILAYLALLLAVPFWPASVLALASTLAVNRRLYRFLIRRRGVLFGLLSTPLLLFYFLYSGAGFLTACCIWSYVQCRQMFRRGDTKIEASVFDGPSSEPVMTSMISEAPAVDASSTIASRR
jgi:glycosyltransferase involved in cell wall biosynthesis